MTMTACAQNSDGYHRFVEYGTLGIQCRDCGYTRYDFDRIQLRGRWTEQEIAEADQAMDTLQAELPSGSGNYAISEMRGHIQALKILVSLLLKPERQSQSSQQPLTEVKRPETARQSPWIHVEAKFQAEDSLTSTLRHAQKCVLLHALLTEAAQISVDLKKHQYDEEMRMTLMQMELELPGMAASANFLVADAVLRIRAQSTVAMQEAAAKTKQDQGKD